MKYKQLGLLSLIPMLLIALLGQGYVVPVKRYHQHIEAPRLTPCSDHDEDVFCTHLPLINITTDDPIPTPYLLNEKGEYVKNEKGLIVQVNDMVGATVDIYDNPSGNNHLNDTPSVHSRAFTRIRGNSSRFFDKTGYLLHFTEDNMVDKKRISICGMPEDNSWVLHAPYVDRSLIKNYLCYNLSGELMSYAPNVRFCELFINGDYKGLYLLVEKIKRSDVGRIHLSKSDPDLIQTPYIVQIDRGLTEEGRLVSPLSTYAGFGPSLGSRYGQFEIIYPNESLTDVQKRYIENSISEMEHSLYSFDFDDTKLGYRKYIDVSSFIDYYIINEFASNLDSMEYSTFVYKDPRGKMKLAVWDFDLAFTAKLDSINKCNDIWFRRLMKDPYFVNRVIERYGYLRNKYLSDDYLMKYIDDTIDYLGPAVDRDWHRWGKLANNYNFSTILPGTIPSTKEDAIDELKTSILYRTEFLDNNIQKLQLLCHESVNKRFNQKEKRRFR